MIDFVLLIPIVAIVGGITSGVIKRYIDFKEKQLEIMAQTKGGSNADLVRQIEALQAEVAKLRDTSTSYDLTIDHQLHRVEQRLEFLEGKRGYVAPAAATSEENVQRVGGQG